MPNNATFDALIFALLRSLDYDHDALSDVSLDELRGIVRDWVVGEFGEIQSQPVSIRALFEQRCEELALQALRDRGFSPEEIETLRNTPAQPAEHACPEDILDVLVTIDGYEPGCIACETLESFASGFKQDGEDDGLKACFGCDNEQPAEDGDTCNRCGEPGVG